MCRPIRTRTGIPSGHGWAASDRCAVGGRGQRLLGGREGGEEGVALGVDLAAAARGERGPEQPAVVARARCRRPRRPAAAARVEPSMSVNRNVTVPAGSAPSLDGLGSTAGNSSVTSRPLVRPVVRIGGRREIAVERNAAAPSATPVARVRR